MPNIVNSFYLFFLFILIIFFDIFCIFLLHCSAAMVSYLRMKTTIEYYGKHVYGKELEYVCNKSDADMIKQLTGQKTIDSRIRELIHDLSRGSVSFKKVLV